MAKGEISDAGFAFTPADVKDYRAGHRDRMRERLLASGADAFHDYELLEYILGLGRRDDTKNLAKELIGHFGSLPAVIAADSSQLAKFRGVGDTSIANLKFIAACAHRMMQKTVMDKPILSSWASLCDYLQADMAHISNERFRVLFLNNKNALIRDEIMSEGTVNHAPVYVREIVKRGLEVAATAIILVHNHPSGDPKPSQDDIIMTREIIDAARPLGITVHDHIIVGKMGQVSFKQLGLI
jgi:DNA repair protein RadC